MRPEDQERAVIEVTSRVLAEKVEGARRGGPSIEQILSDALWHERRRIDQERDSTEKRADDAFWRRVQREVAGGSLEEQKAVLREAIERFTREVLGHFDERVYKLATGAVPVGFTFLLNAISPLRLVQNLPSLPDLKDNLTIQGEIEAIKALDSKGTIILCPTHVSNLDSIAIGWVLHRLGLPPYVYGAGKNLFSNALISFFMHRLGAYKVDRKKSAPLYKEVLKEYATLTLEFGYDNLFFPGGTRSRSGAVEKRLKLGLLGCGIRAYVNNLKHGVAEPRIYIVPCTLNYQLVLEAENLIDDFLKETGKARYIIEDDEFSQPKRIVSFLSSLFSLDDRVYVTFSKPLDPFGNEVDAEGVSHDRRGRPIDITRYVLVDGKPEHVKQRDEEYTRELGEAVSAAFFRDNVIMPTHLVAFCVFERLRRDNPLMDLYRLLRTGGEHDNLPVREVQAEAAKVLEAVRARAEKGEIRLDERLAQYDVEAVVQDALLHFGTYHTRPAIERKGDRISPTDLNLVFYYHNRLVGYGLGEAPPEAASPRYAQAVKVPAGAAAAGAGSAKP